MSGVRPVMLPGLGADARLFGPQLEAFPTATVPEWIEPRPSERLGAYAERFAATLDLTQPYALVGFSFGGQVALEIASRVEPHRRPDAVVLISGLRSRRAVSATFKLQQAAGRRVPHGLARRVIGGPLAGAFARRDGLDPTRAEELRAMAASVDVAFLFWAASAAAAWDFDGRCPVPVHHVHGRRDRVIPPVPHPELPGGVPTLLDAGHLITWTAADQVNAFIREALTPEGEPSAVGS